MSSGTHGNDEIAGGGTASSEYYCHDDQSGSSGHEESSSTTTGDDENISRVEDDNVDESSKSSSIASSVHSLPVLHNSKPFKVLQGPAPGIELPCKPTLIFAIAAATSRWHGPDHYNYFSQLDYVLAHDLVYSQTSTFMPHLSQDLKLQIVQNYDRKTLWRAALAHQGSHIVTRQTLQDGYDEDSSFWQECYGVQDKEFIDFDNYRVDMGMVRTRTVGGSGTLNRILTDVEEGKTSYQAVILDESFVEAEMDCDGLVLGHVRAFLDRLYNRHDINIVFMANGILQSNGIFEWQGEEQPFKGLLPTHWERVDNNISPYDFKRMSNPHQQLTPRGTCILGQENYNFGTRHSQRYHSARTAEMLEEPLKTTKIFPSLTYDTGMKGSAILCEMDFLGRKCKSFFGYYPSLRDDYGMKLDPCAGIIIHRLCYALQYEKQAQEISTAYILQHAEEANKTVYHMEQVVELLQKQGPWIAPLAGIAKGVKNVYKHRILTEVRKDLHKVIMDVDENATAEQKIMQATRRLVDYLCAVEPHMEEEYRYLSGCFQSASECAKFFIEKLRPAAERFGLTPEQSTYIIDVLESWIIESGLRVQACGLQWVEEWRYNA